MVFYASIRTFKRGKLLVANPLNTRLNIVHYGTCSCSDKCKLHMGRSAIGDSMLCAGDDNGEKDTCQGDSGGPLVCEHQGKWHLEGATSWGYGCASPGRYGVYANIRHLQSWLSDTMANN